MNLSSCVQQNDNSVFCEIEEQTVLLNVAAGKYHGFNQVASRIWQLIASPMAVNTLCEQLVCEFDISLQQCETEVLAFLQNLETAELICIKE